MYKVSLFLATFSGRVRKKTKQFHFPDEDGDDDSGNDEEKDEYQPDSELEEPVRGESNFSNILYRYLFIFAPNYLGLLTFTE